MKKWKQKGSKHYKKGQIEPLDLIRDMSNAAFEGFCLGNIIKYAYRGHKDDLDKIIHYAQILKEELCAPLPKNKSTESAQKELPFLEKKTT